jgi:hypothetical protein
MRYWGIYEAARTYQDGDCVIGSDKVLYLCTKNGVTSAPVAWPAKRGAKGNTGNQGLQGDGAPMPINEGQWLKGSGGVAVWSPITTADVPNIAAKPTYGLEWPISPIDGQEHILVDSFSNPTWFWRCRYNAGSTSTYKWEVIGAMPILIYKGGQVQKDAGSWYTIYPDTIRAPRAGEYVCTASCRTLNNGGAGNYNHFNLYINAPANYVFPMPVYTSGQGQWGSIYVSPFLLTLAYGDLVGVSGAATASPAYYDQVTWSIRPRRVS